MCVRCRRVNDWGVSGGSWWSLEGGGVNGGQGVVSARGGSEGVRVVSRARGIGQSEGGGGEWVG